MIEHIWDVSYKSTYMPAANYPRVPYLVPNISGDIGMRLYEYMYSKYLICIFTNIKEHKNKTEIADN